MTTRRLEFSFPTVATIRKGGPKKKGKNRKGEEIDVVGDDLNDRMRVVFHPGTEDYQALFLAHYQTLEPTKIRAMVPFKDATSCLTIYNEAYQSGRMVARATDEKFITLRNPSTGEYIVQNGEPYTEFKPGKPITYTRNGKEYSLPVRTAIRLKLFLPEIGRMVWFELRSTSFYDACNLRQQILAVQFMADTLNGGIAAGIPFFVFRRQQDITWNKPGGTAARINKWLLNLEIDPEWVAAATRRMGTFALTGQQLAGFLTPGEIAGDEDPDAPEIVDEDEVDGDWTHEEEPAAAAQEPEQPPQVPDQAPPPEAMPEATPPAAEQASPRPYPPDQARARVIELAKQYEKRGALQDNKPLRQVLGYAIEQLLDGYAIEAMQDLPTGRGELLRYIAGTRSLNELPMSYVKAMTQWLQPKMQEDGTYKLSAYGEQEAVACYKHATGLEEKEQ